MSKEFKGAFKRHLEKTQNENLTIKPLDTRNVQWYDDSTMVKKYQSFMQQYLTDIENEDDEMAKIKFESVSDFKGNDKKQIPMAETKTVEIIKLSHKNKTVEIREDGDLLGDYFFEPNQIKMSKVITETINQGNIINVLAVGDTGTGKTSMIYQLRDSLKVPVFYLNCALMRDPSEWWGEKVLEGGNTYFKLSPLAEFIKKGNGIVIFDELNRTDEFTRGILLSLLDDTREIKIQDITVPVGKGTVFYATANMGFSFTGTHTFDKAEYRRFIYLKFDKMTKERHSEILINKGATKEQAFSIVEKIEALRQKFEQSQDFEVNFSFNISKSLQVLYLIKMGLSLKDALTFSCLHGMNQDAMVAANSIINGNYGA